MALDEARRIGIRWTVGDVSARGFEALQLSIWGAWHAFGPESAYAVCVNTISLEAARERTGPVPDAVAWLEAPRDAAGELAGVLGEDMAEGMGWKLAPLQVFPDRWEIALDNDCILWSLPPALRDWLAIPPGFGQCLLAEDVARCYGQFAGQAPHAPFNAGIRGLPPGFDLAAALRRTLARREREAGTRPRLAPDDEQGLQAAALSSPLPPRSVSLRDVSVCSPFHPHLPWLGDCGAHFVGLNARHIPWKYFDRAADDCMAEHWARHLPELRQRTAAPAREDLLAA